MGKRDETEDDGKLPATTSGKTKNSGRTILYGGEMLQRNSVDHRRRAGQSKESDSERQTKSQDLYGE